MKAKEIRIGNYLIVDGNKSLIDGQIMLSILQLQYSIEPIELTKEWMVNFGFKKDIDTSFMKNDVSIFLDKRHKTNLYLQSNESKFVWFGFERRIQYVHELQNLYHALTGDELQCTSNGI